MMHIPDIESIQHSYEHVYISPHMDDVALSCGGRIAKQLKSGKSVLVVTVFAGDVGGEKKHRGMIFDQVVDIRGRRVEDKKAMDRLGADYLWLDYIDSIFRSKIPILRFSLYLGDFTMEKSLYGAIARDIRKICERAGNRILYLPLGAGQHSDHHVLFKIGRQIINHRAHNIEVKFYEDVPYIFSPNILKYRMQLIGIKDISLFSNNDITQAKSIMREILELYKAIIGVPTLKLGNPMLKPFVFLALTLSIIFVVLLSKFRTGAVRQLKISPETCDVSDVMPEKLSAIMEYQTQLKVLLWDKRDMGLSFYEYSRSIGGKEGQYLERYWKIYRNYNIFNSSEKN